MDAARESWHRFDQSRALAADTGGPLRQGKRGGVRMRDIERTLANIAKTQLAALSEATGLGPRRRELESWFAILSESWGHASPEELPLWSGIGDDCSPLEWSVVLRRDERAEMRILAEAHEEPASPASYWHAAEALTQRISANVPLDLERLERVRDLFAPRGSEDEVFFSAFHAAVFWADRAPMLKLYLNPAARGFASATEVTREALARLGFHRAWASLEPLLEPPHVTPAFMSLDLGAGEGGRVKVYLRHRHVPIDSVERAAATAPNYARADLARFFETMAGERASAGVTRAVLTTHYFTDEESQAPRAVALQMPARPYTDDDAVFTHRFRALLEREGIPERVYEQALRALGVGEDRQGAATQSWAAFSRIGGEPRIAAYFSPQFYARTFGPLSLDPVRAWPRPSGHDVGAWGLAI
ncbi:MAG TPA: tryptophan dimethylallyltransferase family protein [Polyangiaceae bacterium]|nr:tryptophan dimethylallyltransferase family protein [Polyangiaceae bacterium]